MAELCHTVEPDVCHANEFGQVTVLKPVRRALTVSFEVLHGALVFLGRSASFKGAEVSATSGLRIGLS